MKQKTFKIKKSIFSKLLGSYILFSVLVIISFIICLLTAAVIISGGNDDQLPPHDAVDENGNIIDMHMIKSLGGWVEKLDENLCVVNVYGDKKTTQKQYTQQEIFALTKVGVEEQNPYIGFMQYVKKKNAYYLAIYERSLVQISLTVMLDSASSAKNLSNFVMFSFLVLYFLNCILLSFYLSRKIKNPLRRIVSGMDRVKAGEENVRLDFKADLEFEQIRDTFNVMISDLEKERRQKAEMERKKSQLLLELSHDIKTPLATIKGYANALENGLVPEEKKLDYYYTIDRKADRVCSLAENMFLMLKMENAEYQLYLEKLDICELVRQICAEHYEEMVDAGFDVEIIIPEETVYVWADEKAFSRVVGNLLLNAKKYNQTGKEIGVQLEKVNNMVEIKVFDDGTLIEKELQDTIFDPFVRGDKARKTNGGTGLGLAISKAIMEKHCGELIYQVENQKNCFVIRMKMVNVVVI